MIEGIIATGMVVLYGMAILLIAYHLLAQIFSRTPQPRRRRRPF